MTDLSQISTFDIRPRWLQELGDGFKRRPDTKQLFAGSYDGGNLLTREFADDEDFDLEATLKAANIVTAAEWVPQNITAAAENFITQFQRKPTRVPRVRRVNTLPQARYILLKKYEGFVTSRKQESFTARLYENTDSYPVLEAEFDLEELSETDRALVVEGAPLVWTIGYRYEGDTRKRESVIYLRRLPPWKDKEIEHAKQEADELVRDIRWK